MDIVTILLKRHAFKFKLLVFNSKKIIYINKKFKSVLMKIPYVKISKVVSM